MTQRQSEILERALDCVHCGLCLSSCPTYRETGREQSSPRGRIYLFRGVAEGRIDLDADVAREAHLCLGCRACESACPSGVEYGRLLELVRADVADAGRRGGSVALLERLVLRHVVPHPRRLRALVGLLGLAQGLGLDRIARRMAPGRLRDSLDLMPRVPPRALRRPLAGRIPARGERRGTVGFFVGCVMPEFFGDVHAATLRVLTTNGFDVVVPPGQGCCGALHAHAGDEDMAHELARKNVAAFAGVGDLDAVILNSAGCGAALRDMGRWLPGEAEPLAGLIRDVSEFLVSVGLRAPNGRQELRVCYDDPCHLVHGQGVAAAPRELLRAIPGLALVDHADPGGCCGAAGTYNFTEPEMSGAVLARKLDALEAAAPDVVATGNPGCLMQLRAGVRSRGLRLRVEHPISLLDAAYV